MHLTYKYRLLPTKAQHRALERILEDQRQLYNAALEERIACYQKTGKGRTYNDQTKALTEWRHSEPEAAALPANLQRWTLKRLDDAYAHFFKRYRSRSGQPPGFPRYKSKTRWRTFGFRAFAGARFDGKRIRFKGMPGGLRVHLHRDLPLGKPLCCVFTRDHRGWTVSFQMHIEAVEPTAIHTSVGLDLGLKVFAYQSDGVMVPNLRVAQKAERQMRRRQRALSRCKRDSKRCRTVKAKLAKLHAKIANARTTWLHQQSARITKSYDLIVAEDLNVSGLIRNPKLARSIADASWATFVSMIAYKAEKAGRHFITVDPRNTSQQCSGCSELVPKSLAVRTHSCPSCGLTIDRDWNAARNILAAVVGGGADNVTRHRVCVGPETSSRTLDETLTVSEFPQRT